MAGWTCGMLHQDSNEQKRSLEHFSSSSSYTPSLSSSSKTATTMLPCRQNRNHMENDHYQLKLNFVVFTILLMAPHSSSYWLISMVCDDAEYGNIKRNIVMLLRGRPKMTSQMKRGRGISQIVMKSDWVEKGCQPCK